MSYILGALKKADDERKQEGSPGLPNLYGSPPAFPKRKSFRSGRALGSVLLVVILAGGIYRYSSMPAGTPPSKPPDNRAAVEIQPAPAKSLPEVKKIVDSASAEEARTKPRPRTIKSDRKKNRLQMPVESQSGKQSSEQSGKQPLENSAAKKTDEIPFLHELPAEVRATIPDLKFAGHTYSATPQNRMIIINGKILKEGDQIDPNSKLAEITWEGVVIETKGVRFKKSNP